MADGGNPASFDPRENPRLTHPLGDDMYEEPRLALSPVIDQTIDVMNEREEQRHKLINTLIVVQLLIMGAIAAGYHDQPGYIFPVMLASLSVYLLALVAGFILKNDRLAAYLLVFGGGAAVAAQVLAAMLAGNPEETSHIALFFLVVILESGLLLTPEVTVVVATAAGALTSAFLLLTAFNNNVSGPQIYLIILYTLSPMALIGILSWLLAHYIYTTTVNVQHAQDLEFRQAQFQQMKAHERDRQQELSGSIGAIQIAISQAITGDYTVRVPVSAGDLEVVERSLNLLLDNFYSLVQAQQENARMTGAMGPLADRLNQLNDSITPVNVLMTDTPLDNVSAMVTRITDSYSRRVNRMQEQLARVSAGVTHSRGGLANASDEFVAAKRQAGALISRADAIQASLQKQLELLAKARRMMSLLLPPEITQMAQIADGNEGGNPALRGLGIAVEPGLTQEFESLPSTTPAEAGIAPLTVPMRAIGDGMGGADGGMDGMPDGDTNPQNTADARSSSGSHGANGVNGTNGASGSNHVASKAAAGSGSGEIPAELVEVWHLLLQVGEELNQQERTIGAFIQELGMLSRNVRNADRGMAWTLSALDAVQRSSDSTAQQSSAQHPIPGENEHWAPSDSQDDGDPPFGRSGQARPLWHSPGTDSSIDSQLPRGSLNGSDLLGGGGDLLNDADLSVGDPDNNPESDPGEDAQSGS